MHGCGPLGSLRDGWRLVAIFKPYHGIVRLTESGNLLLRMPLEDSRRPQRSGFSLFSIIEETVLHRLTVGSPLLISYWIASIPPNGSCTSPSPRPSTPPTTWVGEHRPSRTRARTPERCGWAATKSYRLSTSRFRGQSCASPPEVGRRRANPDRLVNL